MGKLYEKIDEKMRDWLERQVVFFVATAPLAGDGHVNLSPKGSHGTFRVLDEHTVAYLDLTASGIETIAHLRENGRITLMFCAFDGPPNIVRIHGRGRAVTGGAEYDTELTAFAPHDGSRAIIEVVAERISDSCGYNVPLMPFG